MNSPLPDGTQLINPGSFDVPVRLLFDPRGCLLIQTETEIKKKYRDMRDDLKIAMAAETEEARNAQRSRLSAAEDQETLLFRQLEEQRGSEFQSYIFIFRPATIEDEECAEAEAAKTQPRQELAYRRLLCQRTFIKTDFPEFKSFSKLRTDVALFVFREVTARVMMSAEVASFLLTPAESSVPG